MKILYVILFEKVIEEKLILPTIVQLFYVNKAKRLEKKQKI